MIGALPDDHMVTTWQDLCLALHDDKILDLISKADVPSRARLARDYPLHVAAWLTWTRMPTMTAAELAARTRLFAEGHHPEAVHVEWP